MSNHTRNPAALSLGAAIEAGMATDHDSSRSEDGRIYGWGPLIGDCVGDELAAYYRGETDMLHKYLSLEAQFEVQVGEIFNPPRGDHHEFKAGGVPWPISKVEQGAAIHPVALSYARSFVRDNGGRFVERQVSVEHRCTDSRYYSPRGAKSYQDPRDELELSFFTTRGIIEWSHAIPVHVRFFGGDAVKKKSRHCVDRNRRCVARIYSDYLISSIYVDDYRHIFESIWGGMNHRQWRFPEKERLEIEQQFRDETGIPYGGHL